jgi:hypothetical protein
VCRPVSNFRFGEAVAIVEGDQVRRGINFVDNPTPNPCRVIDMIVQRNFGGNFIEVG